MVLKSDEFSSVFLRPLPFGETVGDRLFREAAELVRLRLGNSFPD